MNFDLFTYLTNLGFIYVYSRLAIHLVPILSSYFFDSSLGLKSQLEKPRLLYHLTGLSIMHLMFYFRSTALESGIQMLVISLIVFSLGIFFCHFTWTIKFKNSLIPNTINTVPKPSENFNISISDSQVVRLYEELVRFDLINNELTSLEDLKNVLLKDWSGHDSKLHLKMDGPSGRDFYDFLIKAFPNNTFTLKNFFSSSNLVRRPDGKKYNYNTIKNAPTKNQYSKRHSDLTIIFQKITS